MHKTGNFGEWVRRNCVAHGKTITWLASEINGNPTMVLKWRKGVEPRGRNYINTCLAIAKLRGDHIGIVMCEAAAHLGVQYEYTIDNPQCACDETTGNK